MWANTLYRKTTHNMLEATAPQQRGVASGVVNLGNTCYMNAVLQALAHAPELCLAIDYEPHHVTCPVARGNKERRRNSPIPSEDSLPKRRPSVRKSRRVGRKSPTTDSEDASVELEFCTLCEVENHLSRVHHSNGDPVAPDSFVNGFVEQVAPPWFKLGVQEDSHEFLRLLIEAMQKSSKGDSRDSSPITKQSDSDKHLYPFKLFRGTVESNVSCDSCGATSSTIDPIEDIGLEVTHSSGSFALADLSSAFQRFTKPEPLTGYKCDRCRTTGRATKQSCLASIPPILTLHLKRFRYGSDGKPLPPVPRRGREVSQLTGASGSAKIEGHIKFLEIFDLKPFLTEKLAAKVKSMFCRLFAVIVHAGKNSHSGHYVAYVRNLSKNEWWKMDDARVSRATSQEVLNAEAYMLFYRVVDHPVAQQLRAKQAEAVSVKLEEGKQKAIQVPETVPDPVLPPPLDTVSDHIRAPPIDTSPDPVRPPPIDTSPDPVRPLPMQETEGGRKRKRDGADFRSGEDWARSKTRLPPTLAKLLRRAENFISEKIDFTPEFFKLIMDEAAKRNGNAPSGITGDDIQGGIERFRPGLIELIYKLSSTANLEGGITTLLRKDNVKKTEVVETTKREKPLIVPVVDANEAFL